MRSNEPREAAHWRLARALCALEEIVGPTGSVEVVLHCDEERADAFGKPSTVVTTFLCGCTASFTRRRLELDKSDVLVVGARFQHDDCPLHAPTA